MQIQCIRLEECRKAVLIKKFMSCNKHIRNVLTKQSMLALIQRWPHNETNATWYSQVCVVPAFEFRLALWLAFHQQNAADVNVHNFWARVMENLVASTFLFYKKSLKRACFWATREALVYASKRSPRTLPSVSFSLLTLSQASHCVKNSAIGTTMPWASPRQLQWRGSVGQGWCTTSPLLLQPPQYELSNM